MCFVTTVLSILLLYRLWDAKEKRLHFFSVRTSYGMFFKRGQDKVIRAIEKRIADYTLIPVGTVNFTRNYDFVNKFMVMTFFHLISCSILFSCNFYDARESMVVALCLLMLLSRELSNYALILSTEHGEGLHVLHYKVGQKYNPHYDYFVDEFNTRNGGQRTATLLMYL